MQYLIFLVILIMSVRTASFGIVTMRERNIAGGIAVLVLAVLAIVSGVVVLY